MTPAAATDEPRRWPQLERRQLAAAGRPVRRSADPRLAVLQLSISTM
jgi:hypothetical protein